MLSRPAGPGGRSADGDIVRRSVGADGGRVSYLATEGAPAGSGPALLLIHGSGVSARSWTEQLRGLGRALRVLAVDLPGHGESDPGPQATVEAYADAAHGMLEALGTGPVFVAGHSLGGAVALALAARHPEAVRGLVLLSAGAKLPEAEGSMGRVLYWFLPGPLRKLVFFSMAKKVLFAPGAPSGAVRLGMEELRTCRPDTILKDVAAARAMDLEEAARGLRVPALILCGSRDSLTPPALSQRLHEFIPGSRLEMLEGAGHMLPLEAAGWVTGMILDLVDSVAPGAVARPSPIPAAARPSIVRRLLRVARGLLRRG